VSRGAAYAKLHPKLLKSYVFDGLLDGAKEEVAANETAARAEAFLKEIGLLVGQPFPSVGLGLDYRFKSKDIAGSALRCDGQAERRAACPRLIMVERSHPPANTGRKPASLRMRATSVRLSP